MSSRSVKNWLQQLGLDRYAGLFEQNDIDWSLLQDVDNETLKDIGITSAGHRLRIVKAIAQIDASDGSETVSASNNFSTTARPERRQLTVMFCDLVGSSALAARLDPEDWREVVRAYQNAAAEVVEQFDGHVAQYLGDGLLVYFGFPRAHEDDVQRAVHAGLGIVERINQINSQLTSDYAVQLAVRIGVHTGPVVVGEVGSQQRQENLAIGQTPNVAARLQAVAAPGRVVVSNETRRLLASFFEFSAIDDNSHGLSEISSAHVVVAETLVETRFAARTTNRTDLIGRQLEMSRLTDCWEKTCAQSGQVVILSGEAGIGKSRLVRALTDELRGQDYIRITYQCSPYHSNTTLHPAVQHIVFGAGIAPTDSDEKKLNKLEELIRMGSDNASQSVSLLGSLIGIEGVAEKRHGELNLNPQERREKTLSALHAELLGAASKKPVLLVVEDAHWIDPTTLELIETVVPMIANKPVMLVYTTRSEFDQRLDDHPSVSRLMLSRLGREPLADIVHNVTGGKSLPQDVLDVIATKTDGVPLFVEELTKNLLESGQLIESDGQLIFRGQLNRTSVPSSLQDSLMARLDRLQSVKIVAQAGACIGREFSHELLAAVLPLSNAELMTALRQLLDAELVFRTGSIVQASYKFKHALVRDAAHESLVNSQRVHIHHRIFDAFQASAEVGPEVLAYHAQEAKLAEESIRFSEMAADQALKRSAFNEAINHFERINELLESDLYSGQQARKLDVLMKHSQTSVVFNGYAHPDTVALFVKAREISDSIQDSPHRFPVLWANWSINNVRSDHDAALRVSQQMCDESDRASAGQFQVMSYRVRGMSYLMMGDLAKADKDFGFASSRRDPASDKEFLQRFNSDSDLAIRTLWGHSIILQGDGARAFELVSDVEERALNLNHIAAMSHALGLLIHIFLCARTDNREHLIRQMEAVSTEYGLKMWMAAAACYRGQLQHEQGQFAAAVDSLQLGITRMKATHTVIQSSLLYATLASSLGATGRSTEAAQAQEMALALTKNGSEQWASAEVHRLIGEHQLYNCNDSQFAINQLEMAKSVSRKQGAGLWELRAATTHARVLDEMGERNRGVELLSQAIDAAVPGAAQLPDMLQACQMLDSLSVRKAS